MLQLDIEFWDHKQNKPIMTSFDWKRPALEILLNVYRDHPILYDMRHPKYYAKLERQKALNTIIEMLEDHRPGTTTGDILKKIQTMRTQFGQEFGKVRKAQAKGAEYIPTVWWYDYLAFLRKHIKPRMVKEELDDGQGADDDYMSVAQSNDEYDKYEYAAEESYEIENEGDSEIVYEIQSTPTTKGSKTDFGSETKFIRKRDIPTITPVTVNGSDEIIYEITNSNTIVPKRKIESTPVAIEPAAKQQRTESSAGEQPTSSPKVVSAGTVVTKKSVAVEISVEPDRYKSFGQFVASQIAAVKDDFLFYSTQMEVLNVINKAQLKQLEMDKEAASNESKP